MAQRRVDIEVRRIGGPIEFSWELTAKNSIGQEWMQEELMLQNTGTNIDKIIVNDWALLMLMLLDDSVNFEPIGGELKDIAAPSRMPTFDEMRAMHMEALARRFKFLG